MVERLAENVRMVWPDPNEKGSVRIKRMATEYRELAKRGRQREQELLALLAKVDVSAMSDMDAARQVYQQVLAGPGDDAITELDEKFFGWGQSFHLDEGQQVTLEFDDDDVLPIRDAAIRCGMEFGMMQNGSGGNWLTKARMLGRVSGIRHSEFGWLVRVGDVRQLLRDYDGQGWRAANPEGRPGPAVVTVPPRRNR